MTTYGPKSQCWVFRHIYTCHKLHYLIVSRNSSCSYRCICWILIQTNILIIMIHCISPFKQIRISYFLIKEIFPHLPASLFLYLFLSLGVFLFGRNPWRCTISLINDSTGNVRELRCPLKRAINVEKS